jgi:hypothetical protein
MPKETVLFLPASIRSHVLPSLYLAELLADVYEVVDTATNPYYGTRPCPSVYTQQETDLGNNLRYLPGYGRALSHYFFPKALLSWLSAFFTYHRISQFR